MKNTAFIVEDDEFVLKLVKKAMEKVDWHLLSNKSGNKAFEEIKEAKPDVIILDILLPGVDGIDILKLLKSDTVTRSIPVIMFSNVTDQARIKEAQGLGIESFLIKSMTPIESLVGEVEIAAKK